MSSRMYLCVALGLFATALGAPANAALVIDSNANASVHLSGQLVDQDHDPSGPLTTANADGDEVGGGSASAQGRAVTQSTFVGASASADNLGVPGGQFGPAQADGNAGLNFLYTNDTASAVHAYLDFNINLVTLTALNDLDSAAIGQAASAVSIFASAQLNGSSIYSNALLYGATLTDTGPTSAVFAESFNASLTGTLSSMSCGDSSCQGRVAGTLDLGLVKMGDVLALDYLADAQSTVDPVATASDDGSATASLGQTRLCGETPCTFTTLRLAPLTTAVPEPDTWVSMIAGFLLVGTALRRRTGKLAIA